jgi:uncharacterized protein YbbC (DUF1343 family)/CubicO group peptidase (beta-lactamase class C family)
MRPFIAALILSLAAPALAQSRSSHKTEIVAGFDLTRLALVEPIVNAAIADKKAPGVVLLVGRGDRVVYQKAFGNRAVSPAVEPMTIGTIFDLASLTKVVATTTSVMQLVEQGKVRLSDRVATFIPEFGKYGKADITVLQLMTHVSGLRPDLDLADDWNGYDTAIALACEEVPTSRPGQRFVYSDINYELLGEIVHRVSGQTLDAYVRDHIFQPLGMADTQFTPPAELRARIAPTQLCTAFGWPCDLPAPLGATVSMSHAEKSPSTTLGAGPSTTLGAGPSPSLDSSRDMQMLRGVVHDPTARRMAGVAGHAGLFSTAADLAVFCRMLLAGGAVNGSRVLAPLTINRMISPSTPPAERNVRALGWDMDSSFSSNRGELLPPGSFGHTGFTGTSLWIDFETGVFVVFLSNRVHPDGKGDVTPLRAKVATIVAAALVDPGPLAPRASQYWTLNPGAVSTSPLPGSAGAVSAASAGVLTGLDVARADGFAALKGKRVGLVTNHTGIARDRQSAIDLISDAPGVKLVALFSPEHGIRGILDESVASGKDERTGLPINSLYGDTRRPTDAMLEGIDALVVDLQDIGARFYTYMTTLAYVMEEASKRKLPVFVVDRPNPINGVQIEGPPLDPSAVGFTGYFPAMPIRHGLTMGEVAQVFNGENKIGADLRVIKVKNWRRDDWFDSTGLPWVNPSPNMRNLLQATLYPGIGAIEGTNLSVGRGTDTPFEQVGAPWIDGVQLARELNGRKLTGISFYPVAFTPTASKYANEPCQGVFMVVTDREALRPVRVGLEIASALRRLYGDKYEIDAGLRLFGSKDTLERVKAGEDPARIAASWAAGEARWRALSAKYLLYHD